MDKAKEWQMELLMEKLRSKAGQFKTFTESAKLLRMSILEKRYPVDSVQRNQLQKCLDILQHSIKVTSLQGMVERLESVTRQLGLKFSPGGSPLDWFISSDMFYLEVMLESTGGIKDVRIHHEGKVEQQSCEELVACLSRGDFADFTAQLEGLASIYQLNAEKKVKCNAFSALQSLESDLGVLASLQAFIKEPFNLVHKSPVGILEKRRGGHAMKLTYLVPPYDLLDQQTKTSLPLSVEEVTSRNLGYSVMVCMEGSTAHKLQITPLISVNRSPNGKSSPSYANLNANNSATLPACFVLRLKNPMPMCLALVRRIQQVTEMECGDLSSPHPLLSLVTQHASVGQLDCANNRGLFVTLPDQQHCYFMTESKNLEGILVTNIPFTHPAHVPQILVFLRQQALFNVLVSSCIRPASKHADLESVIMFEVTALSWQHLSISFEHPLEETMTTAELDLTDIGSIKCKVYGASNGDNGCTPEHASKVLQRCWSIPVTMRSLIRSWQSQTHRSNGLTPGGNLSLPPGSDPGHGHGGSNGSHSMPPDFDVNRVKTEPDGGNLPHQSLGSSGSRQGFGPDMSDSSVGFQSPGNPSDNSVSNPFQFSTLLSQGSGGKGPVLLNMLGEQTATSKKQRKRSNKDGVWRRSPKRKQNEECEIVLESSSSDSTPLGTPTSRDAPMETNLDCEEEKPGSDFGEEEIMPLDEVEEIIGRKSKKEKKTSPPTIILDLAESKNLVAPSVSITPITSSSSSFNSVLGLERRPGIEIIPIGSTPATSLPTSITITPISSKAVSAEERNNRDRKSGKSRTEDKARPEKKRNKRKREDSPSGSSSSGVAMGPPDKLPPKQDPLSKPVSVSIKPTEMPALSSVRPSSPAGALRKITSSPTHMSPSVNKSSSSKPSSSHQSPKHSPGYTTSSPKHHGTSSPKHQSSGGSGKPSMSALKSAANSPSTTGKSGSSDVSKVKSSSNKEKDRKTSSSFSGGSSSSGSGQGSSPKLKSSSVKLKQLDLSSGSGEGGAGSQSGGGTPPSGNTDGSKSSTAPQVRNRKGSLSAVIDKLKSAQHQGPEPGEVVKERGSSANTSSKTPGDASGSTVSGNSSKNPGEYMVKSSSEGIKITINKTRKDTKGVVKASSSSTGSGSPKTHTGLKPGVNSGPASKKPHQMLQQKSTSSSSISSSSSSSNKASSSNPSSKTQSTTKSSSSPVSGMLSKSLSKSTGSPKMSSLADSNRRENKPRPPKSGSDREKSVFSKGPERKSSPSGSRDEIEGERPLKLVQAHQKMEPTLPPQLMVEGLMKTLDTKFQIPKLSARSSNLNESDSKKQSDKTVLGSSESSNRMDSSAKAIDLVGKGDSSNTSSKFSSMSKTSDDIKGSKISSIASVTPPLTISAPILKPPPITTFPSISSKLQDINIDTGPPISATTSASVVASLAASCAEPTSGETDVSSRLKPDLSRSGQSSGNSSKEEMPSQAIGKLENPSKSFSSNSNNDPSPLSSLNSSKSLDSSQTKFSSSSSQKQVDDSKKLAILSDMPNKSLNKMAPAPTTSQEAAEILLDMSSSSLPNKPLASEPPPGKLATVPERAIAVSAPSRRNTPPPPLPPPQPSVQVHIVQSPAAAPTTASPMVITSPPSASPCSIDDDLMDEALVGMGK